MTLEEIKQSGAAEKRVERMKANAKAAKERAKQMKTNADTSAEGAPSNRKTAPQRSAARP